MKRLAFVFVAVTTMAVPFLGIAGGRFDPKLSKDQRIVHALNRLTFGPRPADVEHVRKIGFDKWINLQLHPERISENRILAAKLKPLETLQLTTQQILETYQRRPGAGGDKKEQIQVVVVNAAISPQERRVFLAGSTE
jgi:hypothetical protein